MQNSVLNEQAHDFIFTIFPSSFIPILNPKIRIKKVRSYLCYCKYRISSSTLRIFLSIKPQIYTWVVQGWSGLIWWTKQKTIICKARIFIPTFYDWCYILVMTFVFFIDKFSFFMLHNWNLNYLVFMVEWFI